MSEPAASLRCRGWRAETILRLLENNLAIAEDPDNLVVYAAHAKVARDHDSLRAIVHALRSVSLAQASGKHPGSLTSRDCSSVSASSPDSPGSRLSRSAH